MRRDLDARADALWQAALDEGLDPYPVRFELVPPAIMYEFGAYGLPGRFGHWTRGKAYHRMKLQYDLGLHRLYEMVVNRDPAEAFLLDRNTLLENTLVMAHVIAHSDFFRNNRHFQGSAAEVPELVEARAERVRRYEEEYGVEAVEETLDHLLAVEWYAVPSRGQEREPEDLLGYILDGAPLAPWQQDLVAIVRAESLYFAPQIRTKIANEGWASFWHLRLLRKARLADDEYLDFARLHAAVTAPTPPFLNPYRLGLALVERVEAREGLAGAFLMRETSDDLALVRNHLDERLIEQLNLLLYTPSAEGRSVAAREPLLIRRELLRQLENGGRPRIVVAEAGPGRLELQHIFDGRPLDLRHAEETLRHLACLWQGTVVLTTVEGGRRLHIQHDGKHSSRSLI